MARPLRVKYPGAKYHITSRGNGKMTIFHRDSDYKRFLFQLQHALETDGLILYAYVIMPNHFHLFVETPAGNIDAFMRRLSTAYGVYHAKRNQHVGHCFQGRYKAKLVEGDDYILALTRYIHLNPIKVKAFEEKTVEEKLSHLENFLWSSYRSYVGFEKPEEILDYRWLGLMGAKNQSTSQKSYRTYIEAMLMEDDDLFREAFSKSVYALGDEDFIQDINQRAIEQRKAIKSRVDYTSPEVHFIPIDELLKIICEHSELDLEKLMAKGKRLGFHRGLVYELCLKYSGLKQRDLAKYFGSITEQAISLQRRRFLEELAKNKSLKSQYEKVGSILKTKV